MEQAQTQAQGQRQEFSPQTTSECVVRVEGNGLKSLFYGARKTSPHLHVVGLGSLGAKFLSRNQKKVGQRLKLYFRIPGITEEIELDGVVSRNERIPDKGAYKVEVGFRRVSEEKKRLLNSVANDPLLCETNSRSKANKEGKWKAAAP